MPRFLLVLAVLLVPVVSQPQWVPAAGEDASIPPFGTIRLGVTAGVSVFDERFSRAGDGAREPFGTDFSGDSVSIDRLPSSLIAPAGIRALTGMSDLTLSLGRMDVRLDGRVERLPISLEFGMLPRLSISATVPIVRTWANVLIAPGLGEGATIGINPALFDGTALARNTALVEAFATATAQLRERLDQCAGSVDPECDSINSDRAAAEALADTAEIFGSNLSSVYLNSAAVPVAATPAEQAIAARIAEMRDGFSAYGFTALADAPPLPVAATPLSNQDLQRLITDPAFGINADPLVRTERVAIGDVEFGARFLVIDAMGRPDTAGRGPAAGIRFAVGGLVRLATGKADVPFNLIDIGTGDGQRDIEGHALLDLMLGRRFGVSVASRYTRQLEDQVVLRIPEFAGAPFTLANRERLVDRDLGDIVQLEIKPRLAFGEYLAVGGYFAFIRKSSDRHTTALGIPPPQEAELLEPDELPVLDASVLDFGTEFRERRAGFAIAFSSLAAHARGRARFPFELSYVHLRTTGGTGGLVPIAREDRVQMRIYGRLWGRR